MTEDRLAAYVAEDQVQNDELELRLTPWRDAGPPQIRDIVVSNAPVVFVGASVRYTRGDESWDYRVTEVSEPNEWGYVTVQVEPVLAEHH